ncbi:MAG: hypothetical protein Q4G13_08035 [Moraxella sp.]|nr:hypothetical protein [Moraxella sp.]
MSESSNKQNPNNPPSIDDLLNDSISSNASQADDFSFDELDLDNLGDDVFSELDTVSVQDNLDTSADLDDAILFEELNQADSTVDTADLSMPDIDTIGTDVHTNVDVSASNTQFDAPVNPLADIPIAADVPAEPVLAAAPAKKSMFGKKGDNSTTKEKKSPKPSPIKSSKAKGKGMSGIGSSPKTLNYIILGAVIALALLVGTWFLSQSGDTDTPAPTPSPVATAPTPEVATPIQTDTTTEAPAETGVDTTAAISAGEIDAEAILNAEVPAEPTLIKEEIDRLQDKDAQLDEQAKLIDEQLATLEELTRAKEEQIKLLEQQIAQLEQK